MLFNSLEFTLFFPVVFAIYWLLGNYRKAQNFFILFASYFFYGFWDWRFLLLIFVSSLTDYWVGIYISKTSNQSRKKQLLWVSLLVNLGMLGYFKYANFFIENFNASFRLMGSALEISSLEVILPVGISFYTFQTLSYTIDVYRGNLDACKNPVSFFSFVAFFPQLVAGPIERASHLLPQFYEKRGFDYHKALNGMTQIVYGLFKKMVIANGLAEYVEIIFDSPGEQRGSTLAVGSIFFAFQLYCDFSGYSDIAIGAAKLLGFDLNQNFAAPYFSRNMREFWRRWHVSLNTWFRDYLYLPLGGSRGSKFFKVRNIFIIYIVSGFWHGARFSFLMFGFMNFVYHYIPTWKKSNEKEPEIVAQGKWFPSFKDIFRMALTNMMIVSMMIAFRATTLETIYLFHKGIFSSSLFSMPKTSLNWLLGACVFAIVEWFGREYQYALEWVPLKLKPPYVWAILSIIFFVCLLLKAPENPDYIYFQF